MAEYTITIDDEGEKALEFLLQLENEGSSDLKTKEVLIQESFDRFVTAAFKARAREVSYVAASETFKLTDNATILQLKTLVERADPAELKALIDNEVSKLPPKPEATAEAEPETKT